MEIFLTGGAGYVGSILTHKLLSKRYGKFIDSWKDK